MSRPLTTRVRDEDRVVSLPRSLHLLFPDKPRQATDFADLFKMLHVHFPTLRTKVLRHVVGAKVYDLVYDREHYGVFAYNPLTMDLFRAPGPAFILPLTELGLPCQDGSWQAGRLAPEDLHQPGVPQL